MRRPRRSRFSIGSAPLTSITKSDAQISGGETRQDLKIPGVSPWWLPRALSCSCLSVYRCHSAVMAAFISFHAWHSIPGRQFAPSWTVCTNPPFSPTAAPFPVTINLSPTRKDTTKRHWQQPLVNRMCERCIESSWSGGLTAATLKGQIWWHVSHKTVTTVRESARIN